MLQAILFDLDGTLLSMDNDYFVKVYFGCLARKAAEWGYTDVEKLTGAIWKGVGAMVKNDGSRKNEEAFWTSFSGQYGKDTYEDMPRFNAFYANEFHQAREVVHVTGLERRAVEAAKKKAEHVILATNPIFPPVAVRSRLSWIGLAPEDFEYVTDYTNSCHCKPNPDYYRDILARFSLDADRCLMIGNDAEEDMTAAGEAGISSFLVTDFMLNRKNLEITCPHGTYAEMVQFIENLGS